MQIYEYLIDLRVGFPPMTNQARIPHLSGPEHQDNISMYTPYTPSLYSKTGIYRDIFFLIFDPKHGLWVLCTHNQCFE